MTNDELEGLIQDISSMCANKCTDGILVIALYNNGTSMFCATGSNNTALADSAASAAEILYKETIGITPPSLLH